ncbi:MAG: hypothetical protein ACI9WS_000977, partial [Paraglaciecola psychrophila]
GFKIRATTNSLSGKRLNRGEPGKVIYNHNITVTAQSRRFRHRQD